MLQKGKQYMMYAPNLTIKSLAEDDRPREKMMLKGRSALSDSELMAILIATGTKNESALMLAQRLLAASNNRLDELGKLSIQELKKFKGIGEAKAITLLAALELGRRRQSSTREENKPIKNSADAYHIFKQHLTDLKVEEFWALYLNRANKNVATKRISTGGMTGTVVDTRVIFKDALDHGATSMILAHNHPSGQLRPSQSDIDLTKKLVAAGKIMDVHVVDHVIVCNSDYFSFADQGLL